MPAARSRIKTIALLGAGLMLGFSLALTANVLAQRSQGAQAASAPAPIVQTALPWEDARLLAEVLARIEREYVDNVDDHSLMESAVRGMVASLDPHSAFLDRAEFEEMQESTSGAYPGIGIEVAAGEHGIEVLRPIEGAPAERAGIRAGDVIVKIDSVAIDEQDIDAAISRMRGQAGTAVQLSVRRAGADGGDDELLEFAVRRTRVEVHSASYAMLEPGYGYIRISHFSETTLDDVRRAVADLRRNGAPLAGVLIDLRSNPGGLLDAAVEVADEFLDSGTIVTAEGRTDDARFRMDAESGDALAGVGLTVLVNGGSASAAEILAGALRDNRRATLVGRKTYGKGSVQTVLPLSNGRAVKLTTSRYFTPSGASINEVGITPDVTFAGADEPPAAIEVIAGKTTLARRDPQVALALDALKRSPRLAGAAPAAR